MSCIYMNLVFAEDLRTLLSLGMKASRADISDISSDLSAFHDIRDDWILGPRLFTIVLQIERACLVGAISSKIHNCVVSIKLDAVLHQGKC